MPPRLTPALRTLYDPARFHVPGRSGYHFEGWYYKLVDRAAARPLAVIPGVVFGSDAHAFVQVLDAAAGQRAYVRYPVDAFTYRDDVFAVQVGPNRFTRDGVVLDVAGDGLALAGAVHFGGTRAWPVRPWSPGAMGPFAFLPGMECRHGIVSLDHVLRGTLRLGGDAVAYDGGRGYTEKDWGRGFPESYVWIQANRFEPDAPGGQAPCLTLSLARIPWRGLRFDGFIGGLLVGGRLHRFCTYTGARLRRLEVTPRLVRVALSGGGLWLEVEAVREEAGVALRAPVPGGMTDRVAQTMTAAVAVRLFDRARGRVFEGRSDAASVETQRAEGLRAR